MDYIHIHVHDFRPEILYVKHFKQSNSPSHHFKLDELLDVRWKLGEVIVAHVKRPKAGTQVGKVGREGLASEVVVGQVQDLQSGERAESSGQFTQPVDTGGGGGGGGGGFIQWNLLNSNTQGTKIKGQLVESSTY